MKFSLVSGDAAKVKGDVLLIPLFEGSLDDKKRWPAALAQADRGLGGVLVSSARQEGFKGKGEQTFSLHTHGKLAAARVVLLGLGAQGRYRPEALRLSVGRGVRAANKMRAASAVVCVAELPELQTSLKAATEGAGLGVYRFDRYRTTNPEEKNAPRLEAVAFLVPAGDKAKGALRAAVDLGGQIAEATNWARDLVNEPAGVLTPARLAEEAQKAGRKAGFEVTVAGRKEITRLKMGMFLGVAQGSVLEPQFIQARYVPKNAAHAKRPALALVGKAITFDSGGLSLKTAEGMVDMKTDMAGSAAVLGAMQVIARLAPPFPVHAFIGACENMPSGTAYRPGDVLISRLGKTVEITNTDAEGRLVLGDMLAYAAEQKPEVIIDLATLTGACMIALGHYITGAFGDDDEAVNGVLEAARSAGEELWRMPVTELQRDALRSEIADMKNAGERWGGAINAALFLKEFVGKTPWVHLDVAGPSQSPKERGYHIKGATGVGVRTLVEWVRQRSA